MIIQSPETEMPEPYKTYVGQRSDAIAGVLGEVVQDAHVQLCPRAILEEERVFDEEALIYGVVVDHMYDGYKTVLYDGVDSDCAGLATSQTEEAETFVRRQLEVGNRVRVKDPKESDGKGQHVVTSLEEFASSFQQLNREHEPGVVLMPHLDHIAHRVSVGFIDLGTFGRYAYLGNEETMSYQGSEVYGGTRIGLFRISRALKHDEVAKSLDVPQELVDMGFAAIRRYADRVKHIGRVSVDVVQGVTDNGTPLQSVIDITPRVGGVTPAEVLAIRAVQTDEAAICFATSRLLYDPERSPSTGYNFVDTDSLVINATVDEVRV